MTPKRPVTRMCELHGLPWIHGEAGCFYCVYHPEPKPDGPKEIKCEPVVVPEKKCKSCDKPVSARVTYCSECRSGDRETRPRKCRRCDEPVKGRAFLCDACKEERPCRSATADSRRRAERHARGLKGRRYVEWRSRRMCLAEVARMEGLKVDALQRRMRQGMAIEVAVEVVRKLG